MGAKRPLRLVFKIIFHASTAMMHNTIFSTMSKKSSNFFFIDFGINFLIQNCIFTVFILIRSSVGAFDPLRLDIFESPWAKSKLDEVRNSSNLE